MSTKRIIIIIILNNHKKHSTRTIAQHIYVWKTGEACRGKYRTKSYNIPYMGSIHNKKQRGANLIYTIF